VRYDEIVGGELVRSAPDALAELSEALTLPGDVLTDVIDGDSGDNAPAPGPPPRSSPPPGPAAPPAGSALPRAIGAAWDPERGEAEDADHPLSRAARTALRFRGVFGTHTHRHAAGTPVLPVFRVLDTDVGGFRPESAQASGLPGMKDAVFVVGPEADHLGWPLVVHRAHRPWPVSGVRSWRQEGVDIVALADETLYAANEVNLRTGDIYVALESACPEPMAASLYPGVVSPTTESRLLTRLVKFPSGERPRVVTGVGLGAGYGDGSDAIVPSVVVDEVVFGDPRFARGVGGAAPATSTLAGQMALSSSFGVGQTNFTVWHQAIQTSFGLYETAQQLLNQMPEDGGLLRIGGEIVAYVSRDVTTGTIAVLAGGRALLGTVEQPHQRGETVTWLEHIPVTTLAVDISGSDSTLPIVDATGFPRRGLVLIGSELVHYTRLRAGALEMPRSSSEPGAKDEKGDGLFRGRFGTAAGGHTAGEAVILFPFRYWDLWAPRSDAPEVAYLGLELSEPTAWFESYFWDWQSSVAGGSRIGVLVRGREETPWDADPREAEGLWVSWDGRPDGLEIPLGIQSDRLEWRVFVEYEPGAFDPATGLAHGWKATPRLSRLGVSYLAPGRVLRSVER
jgi:hypothetical protein